MQQALRALVTFGHLSMDLHVLSEEASTKLVHIFRLTLVDFVILNGVQQTRLRQLNNLPHR